MRGLGKVWFGCVCPQLRTSHGLPMSTDRLPARAPLLHLPNLPKPCHNPRALDGLQDRYPARTEKYLNVPEADPTGPLKYRTSSESVRNG